MDREEIALELTKMWLEERRSADIRMINNADTIYEQYILFLERLNESKGDE